MKHLDQAMRNISGHLARKGLGEARRNEVFGKDLSIAPERSDPVRTTILAKDKLQCLQEMFGDDKVALQLLDLRSKGMTMSEIKAAMGMNNTEYGTVFKRVYRRLKAFQREEVSDAEESAHDKEKR